MPRDIIYALLSDRTYPQKMNYLKFKFSAAKEILGYDPVVISIVSTPRCTLSCDMCPTHSTKIPKDYPHIQNTKKDMSLKMFRAIIDRFNRAMEVHIIGSGEPLLNKEFFDMVEYAAAKKIAVKTFSNGTTILANIDRILNSSLSGITISINGHNGAEFKRMTGVEEGVHGRICESVKTLVEEKMKKRSKLKIKLSFIIDKHNYRSIPEMIRLAANLRVDGILLCNFLSCPYDGFSASERTLELDDAMKRHILGAVRDNPRSIIEKISLPALLDRSASGNKCRSFFSQVRFDGDGNCSSCSMMLLDMQGHASFTDKEIWNNEYFRSMRRIFLANDERALPGPCRVCPDNKGVKIEDISL